MIPFLQGILCRAPLTWRAFASSWKYTGSQIEHSTASFLVKQGIHRANQRHSWEPNQWACSWALKASYKTFQWIFAAWSPRRCAAFHDSNLGDFNAKSVVYDFSFRNPAAQLEWDLRWRSRYGQSMQKQDPKRLRCDFQCIWESSLQRSSLRCAG